MAREILVVPDKEKMEKIMISVIRRAFTTLMQLFLLFTASANFVWAQNVTPTPTQKADRFGIYHWARDFAWDFSKDRLNWAADRAKASGTKTFRVPVDTFANPFGIHANDTVWVEDSVPTGAVATGDNEGVNPWTFVSSNPIPFFGASSHQSAIYPIMHQHYFSGATDTFRVNSGDVLFAYVYLDPSNPPQEVMLQWNDGNWEHRAYWKNGSPTDLINFGTSRYMGLLPATGQWVRLEVPAASVNLNGSTLNGMAFTLFGGRATWDRAGACKTETVWIDDTAPAGTTFSGYLDTWNVISSNPTPFSGNVAHQTNVVSGIHQIYVIGATNPLTINKGDRLFAYVYLDPANPPQEVMLQWHEKDGNNWEHRAYWGPDLINQANCGSCPNRFNAGPLPPTGKWVRLEVPADAVQSKQYPLIGGKIDGFAFTLFNGRAAFDRMGVTKNETVWIDDTAPAGTTFSGYPTGLETWNVISSNPTPFSGNVAHQTNVLNDNIIHQIYVIGATDTFKVNAGDNLFAYVYLDGSNPPDEVMLQWYENGSWEHRAFWAASDLINPGSGCGSCGTLHTNSRRHVGPRPPTNQWVRLEVPAYLVGLEGKTVSGFAFTL